MTDQPKELQVLIDVGATFTRSDGTIVARIYERLTKASRRKEEAGHARTVDLGYDWSLTPSERAYRRGVYDAFQSMKDELNKLL
jgi:hypothetical protein